MYNQRYKKLMRSNTSYPFQNVEKIYSQNHTRHSMFPADSLSGGNSGFRIEVVNSVGSLDTRFVMMHDKEFALRLLSKGYTCSFAPDLRVDHNHTKSILDSIIKSYVSGKYHFQLNKLYFSIHSNNVISLFRPLKIIYNSLELVSQLRVRFFLLIPIIFTMEYLHQVGYVLEAVRNLYEEK